MSGNLQPAFTRRGGGGASGDGRSAPQTMSVLGTGSLPAQQLAAAGTLGTQVAHLLGFRLTHDCL